MLYKEVMKWEELVRVKYGGFLASWYLSIKDGFFCGICDGYKLPGNYEKEKRWNSALALKIRMYSSHPKIYEKLMDLPQFMQQARETVFATWTVSFRDGKQKRLKLHLFHWRLFPWMYYFAIKESNCIRSIEGCSLEHVILP